MTVDEEVEKSTKHLVKTEHTIKLCEEKDGSEGNQPRLQML